MLMRYGKHENSKSRIKNVNNSISQVGGTKSSLDEGSEVEVNKTDVKSNKGMKEEGEDKKDKNLPSGSTNGENQQDEGNENITQDGKGEDDIKAPKNSTDVRKNQTKIYGGESGKDVEEENESNEAGKPLVSSTDKQENRDEKIVDESAKDSHGMSPGKSQEKNECENKDEIKNGNSSEDTTSTDEEKSQTNSPKGRRKPSKSDPNVRPLTSYDITVKRETRSSSLTDEVDEEGEVNYDSEILPCNSCEFPNPFNVVAGLSRFKIFKKRSDSTKISEFCLISVPKEDHILDALTNETAKLSQNYKFHIPDLRYRTLDSLLSASHQLSALDGFVREVTVKLCEHIKTDLENEPDFLEENLYVANLNPVIYLTRFTWNRAKYSTENLVPKIADYIFTRVDTIDNAFKERISEYDDLKSKHKAKFGSSDKGSLLQRYLGDIVEKEHFVLDSNYLKTLLVVVPKGKVKLWLKSYETLCDLVLPRSSTMIFEDETHCLFNVTLCERKVEEFKANAQRKNFVVRDYEYSEESKLSDQNYLEDLNKRISKAKASLFKWSKIYFSECFEAWIHVLALRVFVESVLRFGLPVNYLAVLLLPLKSKSKLTKVLKKLYSHVEGKLGSGRIQDVPTNLAEFEVEKYLPYICFDIDLQFLYT